VEMSPPVAEAMHCLQASARSGTCAQGSQPWIFLVRALEGVSHDPGNASVGEARLGGGCLDVWMCQENGRAIYWVWAKLASRDIRVTSAVLLTAAREVLKSVQTAESFNQIPWNITTLVYYC
jgi:hypothetical protein